MAHGTRQHPWWGHLQGTTLVGSVRRTVERLAAVVVPPADTVPARNRIGLTVSEPDVPWSGPVPPALPVSAGSGPAVAAAVRERALAAGATSIAADTLAALWLDLDAGARRQIAAPFHPSRPSTHVMLGSAIAQQRDTTTCGSSVLGMLAAAGDPLLALWLVTGELVAGYLPPEVRAVARSTEAIGLGTSSERFAALQQAIKAVTNHSALGPFPWPDSFGTPPWGAAHGARFPGVSYHAEMVDDSDTQRFAAQLRRAAAALDVGIPVPLYAGGDLASGLTTAVPRHVVLLTGTTGTEAFGVYEPSAGLVTSITRAELLAPDGPRVALGNWSHASWILLPRPRTA